MFAALVAATLIAYLPAWHGGVLWDDDHHLTRPALQSAAGLWRIWSEPGATQQYYPVVHSAFWLLHRVFGDDTLGYHLVNIVLHATTAFLLALVLRRLNVPGAVLAAAIFALHPIEVESVAWMTELKNTLSGVLILGATMAYLQFDRTRRRGPYIAAAVLFALAVLSKSVAGTMAAAWLVVIWWQRGRLDRARDIKPAVPFLIAGALAGIGTAWIERTFIGAQGPAFQVGALERLLVAGRAVLFYLATIVWPAKLVFLYPRWSMTPSQIWPWLFPLAVLVLLAVAWLVRARTRAPLAAGLYFVGTLVPALGFVNVYPFRYSFVADHFQYLAGIGLIVLVSAAVVTFGRRVWPAPRAEAIAIVVVCLPLAVLTSRQSREYADAATLYRTTLARNPSCWLCANNLGVLELEQAPPDIPAAAAHFRAAIGSSPNDPEAYNNLGNALARSGQPREAIAQYETALRLWPDYPDAHNNYGNVLSQMGRVDDALAQHRLAARLDPRYADAHVGLSADLEALGRHDDALTEATRAAGLDPDNAQAHVAAAAALTSLGRTSDADAEYRAAMRLNPSSADAHHALGRMLEARGDAGGAFREYGEAIRLGDPTAAAEDDYGHALARAGRTEEAIAHLREALRRDPNFGPAHFHLGNVLQDSGRLTEAVEEYRAALAYDDSADVQNNLGIALARLGRFGEAIPHFERAVAINPQDPDARANLARARAALGRGGS